MKTLHIAKNFPLPNKTVTQKLAWLGTTGSGKTYGASKLAEEFWNIGAQFVTIDPVGVWYGLRLSKDGKKPSSIEIPIFGGLHGDVPLEPTGGAFLANLVVDNDLSCIIDVSQFESDAEKARFAADFADRLFFRKKAAPSAMHLFLEECQEFVPQNPQRGEERMLHAFVRMQKLGRNFGIGSSYITQRPQEVNKKALNMAQTLFVFRVTGTHERTSIEKWIEDKSLDESIAQDLPKIPTGHCHVWSPEFLKVSEMIHISEKETFNASATPEVGAAAKKRELAPIDLEKVRVEMAATIEKAKQDDPKLLRKRIFDLESALKKGVPASPASKTNASAEILKTSPMGVSQWREYGKTNGYYAYFERQIVAARDKEWELLMKQWVVYAKRLRAVLAAVGIALDGAQKAGIEPFTAPVGYGAGDAEVSPVQPLPVAKPRTMIPVQNVDEHAVRPVFIPPEELGAVSNPEQKILDAIAWAQGMGIEKPSNSIIAFLSGYTNPRSTGYTNPRGRLVANNLIYYPEPGTVSLNDYGRERANVPDSVGDAHELQQRVLERLTGPQAKILKVLIDLGGNSTTNETLSAAAGYTNPRSTGYTNPRGQLRSFGLIEYGSSGVRAADILFPR